MQYLALSFQPEVNHMLITKQQVLAAFAAMGLAMTVTANHAHANEQTDVIAETGPTKMRADTPAAEDSPPLRAPANVPFERAEVKATVDEPGPFLAEPLPRPMVIAERLVRPLACALTPRELIFPYLITPNVATRCYR